MIGWAIETVVATTVLMAVVLLLRRPVRNAFGAPVAYLLWLLPALRMVLPPLPAGWREHAATPLAAVSDTLLVYVAPAAAASDALPVQSSFDPILALGVLWLGGAVLFFAWHCTAHLLFVRRMLALPNFRRSLGEGAELIETPAAAGPVAFGVLQRFVAVPRDFADRYDADERALAIAHELGHHVRGDLIANWGALAMLAVHWCNPVAWLAYRAFRADQEMANDARVLAGRNAADRHAYARAIVKAAHGGAVSAVCHLHTIDDLKGRLKMLTKGQKSRRVTAAGTAAIAVLASGAMTLTASGTAAAEKVREVAEAIPAMAPIVAAPAVAEVAPAPAPTATAGVAPKKARTQVIVVRDGKVVRYHDDNGAHVSTGVGPGERVRIVTIPQPPIAPSAPIAPPALAEIPAIIDGGECAGKADKANFVINDEVNGKRRVIICSKRIEKHVEAQLGASAQARAHALAAAAEARAEAHAARSEAMVARANARWSRSYALQGLRAGRKAIERDRNLTDAQRTRALEGVDQAIREMETSHDES